MIDRILQAAESRQGYGGTSGSTSGSSSSSMFIDEELKQLSSFSTLTLEQFDTQNLNLNDRGGVGSGVGSGGEEYLNSNSNSNHPSASAENSWSNVDDIESLMALCSILESQVRASLVVNLIQEARSAFDNGNKEVS